MNIYDKIKRKIGQEGCENKLYQKLSDIEYSTYPYEKKDLGDGMSLISQVISQYWKPRFLLNDKTECAYEFMDKCHNLLTISVNDINWDTLKGLCDDAIGVAKRLSFVYPSFIFGYENGVAEVCWELNPDGMYFMDEDGYGMTDDKEINVYGFINKKGKVVVKFQTIRNYDDLKVMRTMAEKKVTKGK